MNVVMYESSNIKQLNELPKKTGSIYHYNIHTVLTKIIWSHTIEYYRGSTVS